MQIKFEISRDPELLEQYFQLRQQCYRQELNLTMFDGSEQPADRVGEILIISQGKKCLGGARIIAAEQAEGDLLSALDSAPTFNPVGRRVCAWERLSISADARSSNLQQLFCAQLINASWRMGYDYAAMVSSSINARYYRRCHASWGVTFETFHRCGYQPKGDFSQLEHRVSVSHLQPVQIAGNDTVIGGRALTGGDADRQLAA